MSNAIKIPESYRGTLQTAGFAFHPELKTFVKLIPQQCSDQAERIRNGNRA